MSEQVPNELVAAAQQADVDWMRRVLCGIGGSWQAVPDEQVRRILAAVLPVHAQQVREQVANELLARRAEVADAEGATLRDEHTIAVALGVYDNAAHIARGGS